MIQAQLAGNEAVLTMTAFPLLGSTTRSGGLDHAVGGDLLHSELLPDSIISSVERYPALHSNVSARRERPFTVKVPIYQDSNTTQDRKRSSSVGHKPATNGLTSGDASEDSHIYGDSLAFGPTCCGLQVTFQAKNLSEARTLHDQLVPLGPIIMALTAATPFFRGYLTDTDVRWNQSTLAIDDRTSSEIEGKVRYTRNIAMEE